MRISSFSFKGCDQEVGYITSAHIIISNVTRSLLAAREFGKCNTKLNSLKLQGRMGLLLNVIRVKYIMGDN